MKKKAVALLVNDIHLNKDNGELVKSIFDQMVSVCKYYNITNIICGGDVFTNRSGQPLSCLLTFAECLDILKKEEILFSVIPGNHDKTDADEYDSYLDVFSNYSEYIRVFRNPKWFRIKDVHFLMMPYFKDEKWKEEYGKVKDGGGDINVMVTHIGFDGVVNNDGSTVESVLKPNKFKRFTSVLVGHYHNASKIGMNVIYTGSAYQNNFGEDITEKGFTIIYDDGSIKHTDSKFPQYIKKTIKTDDKETLRNLLEIYGGDNYNHIRFEFVGKKSEFETINTTEIQNEYGIECRFKSDEDSGSNYNENDETFVYTPKELKKDFVSFCAENKISGERLKYGLMLMKNAVCGIQ